MSVGRLAITVVIIVLTAVSIIGAYCVIVLDILLINDVIFCPNLAPVLSAPLKTSENADRTPA